MTAIRRAGFDFPWHVRVAGRALAYLLLAIPYGLGYLVLLPAAAFRRNVIWRLVETERRQANRLLDAHLPRIPRRERRAAGRRALAMLLLKLPVAFVGLVVVAAPIALAVALFILGAQGLSGGSDLVLGPWSLNAFVGLALLLIAVPAVIVAIAIHDAVGRLLRRLAQALLGFEVAGEGPVRQMLAERLGDRSLNVAYWLPDRQIFVDERGRPVTLPGAGSGRAWTAVEREGNRVAAIVHDAELDAPPELVHAAASAAALALDNERLKADLRARLEELRHSRRRIVEAADEARRRIERDLHDGAQQQLVSLALDLRLLRARVKDDPEVAETVEQLADKLAAALAELRELARGIHPAVLSDHGLATAVHVLIERAPLPVECDLDVDGPLPQATEAAAYFVVAEGLTNVVKYANATSATVSVHRRDGDLEVVVGDNGVGGAEMDAGSGLRGLSDRLAALEGELELESPLGEGTRLTARIPARGES